MRAGGSLCVMTVVAAACNVGEVVPADAPIASDASVDAPGPGLAITPSQTDFGTVGVGQTSAHVAVVVSTGSPTGGLKVSFVGPNASDFKSLGGNCDGAVLAQPGSCAEWVVFRPGSPGTENAVLTITGVPGGSVSTALTGTAVSIDGLFPGGFLVAQFGNIVVGQASTTQRFTFVDGGSLNVGPLITTKVGSNPGDFEVVTDTCHGQILGPSASCTVDTRFRPTSIGAKAAGIVVAATTGGAVNGTLSGTGIVPPVALAIMPSQHDFGTAPAGATTAPFTFTVMNTGAAPTAPLATTITPSSNPSFAIVPGTNACTGITLAAGASCTLQIRFTSTSPGTHSGVFEVTDGTATATGPLLGLTAGNDFNTLSPSQVAFPNVVVGASSAPQLFTVTNGPWTTHASGLIEIHGTAASEFSIATDNCTGASLAPSAACTFTLVFSPTSRGPKAGAISALFTPGAPTFASITGTGVAP